MASSLLPLEAPCLQGCGSDSSVSPAQGYLQLAQEMDVVWGVTAWAPWALPLRGPLSSGGSLGSAWALQVCTGMQVSRGAGMRGVGSWSWVVRRPEALILSFLPPPEPNKKRTKGQKRSLLLKKPLRIDLILENTSKVPAPKE